MKPASIRTDISRRKSTYEIIDPKSVGVPEGKLVLGKHSGRHALKQRCEQLGLLAQQGRARPSSTSDSPRWPTEERLLDEEIAGPDRKDTVRKRSAAEPSTY